MLKTRRTGSADDFSLPMLLMFVGGVALWLAYGLALGSVSIIAANATTLLLSACILRVKWFSRRTAFPVK